jgi:putative flippase GtrA
VGLTGIAVNSAALWAAVDVFGLPVALGAIAATQVSTSWNFLLTELLVYRRPTTGSPARRFWSFLALSNVVLLARVPALALLVDHAGMHYLLANVVTLVAAFLVRFLVSDRVIYGIRADLSPAMAPVDLPSRSDA